MNHCFMHLADLGKEKNKRIYIGPGRDGSSEDKIAVDCKFQSATTKINYSTVWIDWGYRKSSFVLPEEGDENWKMIEDQAEMWYVTLLDKHVHRMVVITHPRYRYDKVSLLAIIEDEHYNDEQVIMFRTDFTGNAYYASDDSARFVRDDANSVSPNGEPSTQCLNMHSQKPSQAENILLSKELRADKRAPDFPEGTYRYDCCTLCRRTFGPRDRIISCTLCGTPHCLRCGQCPLPEGWNI